VLELLLVESLHSTNGVQRHRGEEQHKERDREGVLIQDEHNAALAYRPRCPDLRSDIPRIFVLRRFSIDRLRFRRAPLVEEGSQDDVHAHLQKLRLPVLEGGLDEISGCKVPEHRKPFVGTVFDAQLINDADRGFKDRAGRLAYVLTGLRHVRDEPVPTKIRVDGRKWFDGPATCVLFGNVGTITGGIRAFDDARPDDGYLDVGVVTAQGALQWGRTLGRAAAGRSERSPFVEMSQGRVIDVKFAEPLAYELDGGERGSSKRLQATVVPAALSFCVPEE
jgi:putative lipid kinase YegS-like protein